jgi:protocatechuate 3,4-dioxygenase alpha subunit
MMKQTPNQTVGPFLRIGMVYGPAQNKLVSEQTSGQRIGIRGLVFDGEGQPVTDALVEIWQPDAQGIFDHPADPRQAQADPHFRGFGRSETHRGGQFEFQTIKPGSRDGAAPYVNVRLFARGMLIHAVTRIYFADEAANETDPVLNSIETNRRQTLLATPLADQDPPVYQFDIHIQGENETVFFNP